MTIYYYMHYLSISNPKSEILNPSAKPMSSKMTILADIQEFIDLEERLEGMRKRSLMIT